MCCHDNKQQTGRIIVIKQTDKTKKRKRTRSVSVRRVRRVGGGRFGWGMIGVKFSGAWKGNEKLKRKTVLFRDNLDAWLKRHSVYSLVTDIIIQTKELCVPNPYRPAPRLPAIVTVSFYHAVFIIFKT